MNMTQYKLEKWNLDELIKNPNRKNIDKKLDDIEKNVKNFEKNGVLSKMTL